MLYTSTGDQYWLQYNNSADGFVKLKLRGKEELEYGGGGGG